MTPTERQRRWRQGKRSTQSTEPSPPNDPSNGAEAEPGPPERTIEPEPAADGAYEELRQERNRLRRERDEAVRERNQMYRELEEAREQRDAALRGGLPQPVMINNQARICWCSFCGKRWGEGAGLVEKPQVETMLAGSVGLRTFICNECVAKFSAIIAEKRRSNP
jgi:hypothetical protein